MFRSRTGSKTGGEFETTGENKERDWMKESADIAGIGFISQTQLDERAVAYARTGGSDDVVGLSHQVSNTDQWILFRAGGELFTVAVETLDEVATMPAKGIILPNMPEALLGLINLRGEALLLVDLARMLGLTGSVVKKKTHRVLLFRDEQNRRTGFLVEAIEAVTDLEPDHFQKHVGNIEEALRYVEALAERDGHTVARLDVNALLQGVEALIKG